MDRSLIIAVLSLLLGAALITGAVHYVGANDIDSGKNADVSGAYTSGIPTTVAYVRSDVYTTYYGTFEPIPEVLEKNEYMTLHPTILTAAQSNWYITEQDGEDSKEILKRISDLSDEICKGQKTERDKAYALAMWVGQNVAYDFDAEENGSARNVISLKSILENDFRTTCGGFANLYAALCNAQGIYCLCMKGASVSENYTRDELSDIPSNHNWNAVAADGEWYYVDCTWISDLSYRSGQTVPAAEVRPFYALMGFGEMSIEHRIDRCEYRKFNIDE
ncbi:MAG: hypothetical protein K2N72_03165 [Oscillospiraceae bacterium]|nr:hypothetical protein [Oscillospiraceae bacterium]